jgi:hypothetical protein
MSNELKSGVARRATLGFACLVGVLALAACGDESGNPTQPEAGPGSQAPPSLATASSNTWATKAPKPNGDGDIVGPQVAGVVPDAAGRSVVYVFGGFSGSEGGAVDQVLIYSVATNTWTIKSLSVSPTVSVALTDFNGVGTIGSQLYLSGGRGRHSEEGEFLSTLYVYDPANDRTTRKADMPLASGAGVSGVIDSKLYVLPGVCETEGWPDPGFCEHEATRRFFRYNPATNTWATRPWAPHFHECGAAGVINGKFYVAGGQANFSNVADLDVYDPVTNKWKTLAPLPRVGCAVGAVMNHKLFVISGSPFAGGTFTMYAYDPVTNSWTTKAAPAAARAVARVAVDGRNRLFSAGPPTQLYTP